MKKIISKVLAVMILCVVLGGVASPVQAAQHENTISPLYVEPITINWSAEVSGAKELSIGYSYSVGGDQVTDVVITTYVEKRSLLVIWNRVDIGETNDEWVDHGTTSYFSMNHSTQLPSSGTYRVTIVFDVYNGNTLIDTTEKTQTVEC